MIPKCVSEQWSRAVNRDGTREIRNGHGALIATLKPQEAHKGAAAVDGNARLIASAPELLSACEAAVSLLDRQLRGELGNNNPLPVLRALREALARAGRLRPRVPSKA